MALFDWLFGSRSLTFEAAQTTRQTFAVDAESVPAEIFGFASYSDPTTPVGRISRAQARQVPAVKRARDIICGTLGGIPLQVVGPDFKVQSNNLLDQPERDVPRSVTFTRLFEDLFYEGLAWWKITETDYRGYPVKVSRLDPEKVVVNDGKVWVNGRPVQNDQLIRFDSPNGSLLADGARAIKTLLRLEAAAAMYAEDPMPQGYFAPVEDADPVDDDDIKSLLSDWKTARQTGATGYVPAALKYEAVQFTPEQLQMGDARQHAVLEIARLTGIDAEDLSVSTTSRTYFNGQDRRLERIADVLGPYSLAVTDRLRMRDITPLGYSVRADFSSFLRADDKTRYENYQLAQTLGLLSLDDIAEREGLPAPAAPAAPTRPALTAVPNQQEVSA